MERQYLKDDSTNFLLNLFSQNGSRTNESRLGHSGNNRSKVDSTGDIAIVSDLNCVTQDMNILLGTATKELTFTPNFGIGLIYFQNKPFNMTNQAKLSNRISQSLLADDRIKEINSIIFEHDEFYKSYIR